MALPIKGYVKLNEEGISFMIHHLSVSRKNKARTAGLHQPAAVIGRVWKNNPNWKEDGYSRNVFGEYLLKFSGINAIFSVPESCVVNNK